MGEILQHQFIGDGGAPYVESDQAYVIADYRVELADSFDLEDGEILEFIPKDTGEATSR